MGWKVRTQAIKDVCFGTPSPHAIGSSKLPITSHASQRNKYVLKDHCGSRPCIWIVNLTVQGMSRSESSQAGSEVERRVPNSNENQDTSQRFPVSERLAEVFNKAHAVPLKSPWNSLEGVCIPIGLNEIRGCEPIWEFFQRWTMHRCLNYSQQVRPGGVLHFH